MIRKIEIDRDHPSIETNIEATIREENKVIRGMKTATCIETKGHAMIEIEDTIMIDNEMIREE